MQATVIVKRTKVNEFIEAVVKKYKVAQFDIIADETQCDIICSDRDNNWYGAIPEEDVPFFKTLQQQGTIDSFQ